jgi:hypothetical protein
MFTPDRKIYQPNSRKVTGIYRARTVQDMLFALRDAKEKRAAGHRRHSVSNGYTFCGTHDVDEYIDMLEKGWPAGVEGVEKLEGLSTDMAEKLIFTRNVAGQFPIVPAYLQGQPDCMLNAIPAPAESARGLTLVVDASFNGNVEHETVLDYARQVMQLVAWLSAEQIECAVYAVAAIAQRSARAIYCVPVREAGQTLAPERVASILHPSFLRRGYFALCEYEYHTLRLPGTSVCKGGYGRAVHATGAELRECIPEAYSVIVLPKPGRGDPMEAVQQSETFKLRREE